MAMLQKMIVASINSYNKYIIPNNANSETASAGTAT